jgi:hypothetical protein
VDSVRLAQAVDGLYESAGAPELWAEGLNSFAGASQSRGCSLRPVYLRSEGLTFPASPGLAELREDFIHSGWHLKDPRLLLGAPLLKRGRRVLIEHDLTSEDDRRRSPFHQEFLKRHDLPWWSAVVFTVDERPWCLSILRSAREGPFTRVEAAALARIAPRLSRAVGLAATLALAHGRGAVEALERIGRAAFVLDATGRVALANARADAMMGGPLSTVRGRLTAR